MERYVIGQENFDTKKSAASLASAQTSVWTTGAHSARSSSLLRGKCPSRSVLSESRSRYQSRHQTVLSQSVQLTDGNYDDDTITDLSVIPRSSPSSLDDTDLHGVPRHSSPRKKKQRQTRRQLDTRRPQLYLSSSSGSDGEGACPAARRAIHQAVAGVLPSASSLSHPAPPNSSPEKCSLGKRRVGYCATLGERPPCIGQEAEPVVTSPRRPIPPSRTSRSHVDRSTQTHVPEDDVTDFHPTVTPSRPLSDLHSTVDSDATFFMDAPLNHHPVTHKVTIGKVSTKGTSRAKALSRKIKKFGHQLQGQMTTLAIV